MTTYSVTNTFSNSPPDTNVIDADQVNANFADVLAALNDFDPENVAIVSAARVYHNANQSIPNAASTVLAFNSERFDTDTIHDNATNNSRLTCKTAGLYEIVGHVSWDNNGTNDRFAHIRLNGTTLIASTSMNATAGGGATESHQHIVTHYVLAVNDYVELVVFQNSGGARNVEVKANYSPEFSMVRVGKTA